MCLKNSVDFEVCPYNFTLLSDNQGIIDAYNHRKHQRTLRIRIAQLINTIWNFKTSMDNNS